jgi:hypothetical protein
MDISDTLLLFQTRVNVWHTQDALDLTLFCWYLRQKLYSSDLFLLLVAKPLVTQVMVALTVLSGGTFS